jgi:protein O-mannosyl-transferase
MSGRLSGWQVLGVCSGIFTAWVEKTYLGARARQFALTPLQHILLAAGRTRGLVLRRKSGVARETAFQLPTLQPRSGAMVAILVCGGTGPACGRPGGFRPPQSRPARRAVDFCRNASPLLGFLDIYPFRYSFVADHFQYLASLAIIVPASALLTSAARRVSLPKQAGVVLD